jgi:hypothetical protein
MKKALVGYQGWVTEIVEPGQDFEIYEGPDANMAWVDAPDEITLDWTLEYSPSQGKMIWVERDAPFTNNAVARKVAYGTVEEQLDMIWHEIDEKGSLTKDGDWYQHISAIKQIVPAPPPPEEPITLEELQARAVNQEPSEDKPNVPSTQEMPAWKRYPGWKGYQP